MKKKDQATFGRRGFLKLGAGAGAVTSMMKSRSIFGQGAPAWAARPANTASVRPTSIDMHTHWAPEGYIKAQVEMGRPAPTNRFPLDFDLDKRRKWMDEHGIQMHVLTLSGGAPWQWATPEQGAQLARIVNDAAIEAHTAFPDRFVAGIAIPVKDPVMALKELNRVAGKPELDRAARLLI
jgi:predicted TIM-barrel fold metal-dependent hydrolase